MKRICVYCGSSPGRRAEYVATAEALGRALARHSLGLVYGGASVGMMGRVADAVLAAGGEVIGVIPEVLMNQEVAHRGLTDLHLVGSMHERKALMAELADAFVALPGGFGTLEELFEMITWAQLGIHRKPIGLLNAAGYYDQLVAFLHHMTDEKFIREVQIRALVVDDDPDRLLQRFRDYRPMPVVKRWLDVDQT